jgi:hypothetical protein
MAFRLALALFSVLSLSAATTAQEARRPSEETSAELVLTPQPEPWPSLKYKLLPSPSERSPGNAVAFYYRAALRMKNLPEDGRLQEHQYAWLQAPIDQLPKDEVRKSLAGYSFVLESIQIATYRDHCDWDLRIQDLRGLKTIEFLLEEFQILRDISRILALKARLAIAEGRTDEAIECLRQQYQLAVDCAQPPLLINALIGIAICSEANAQLETLLAQPGTPNLYWAIATLPNPLIDVRTAMQYELHMPLQIFPFLVDAETKARSEAEWSTILREAIRQVQVVGGAVNQPNQTPDFLTELGTAALLLKGYSAAKEALVEAGYKPEEVEKMPVGQVIAIQTSRTYRYAYDELFKWTLLDYPESQIGAHKAVEKLRREGYLGLGSKGAGSIPVVSLLLPAIENIPTTAIRFDRNLAALHTIEALRMHAAETGSLPQRLSEITVVPVPKNPATGRPFEYGLDGDVATLEVPSLNPAAKDGKTYRIRLATKSSP